MEDLVEMLSKPTDDLVNALSQTHLIVKSFLLLYNQRQCLGHKGSVCVQNAMAGLVKVHAPHLLSKTCDLRKKNVDRSCACVPK